MKAVVFHDIADIRLEDVPEPRIQEPTDAIVRITASAICGTDLHFVRGTMGGMKKGRILGHEAVGVIEKLGKQVRNFAEGDRVVVPSTIACGYCVYCRAGYQAQCDHANPKGRLAGTAFFGGPEDAGGFDGLQAEKARVPYAATGLVRLPDGVTDDQALMCSDIFPTGYFGAELAEITDGDTVAVFGCGPVGQFAIASAKLLGAGRVFAIDRVASRLEVARSQGAEVIDFSRESPVEVLRELTGGIGVDRAIDAVGVDAESPSRGPAKPGKEERARHDEEVRQAAPDAKPDGSLWQPGSAPSQALDWAVESCAKAGTVSIVGVYPPAFRSFPIGAAMNKNLTLKMGNCNHRRYLPMLIDLVESGSIDPAWLISREEGLTNAIDAYKSFDQRESGWLKVELAPGR